MSEHAHTVDEHGGGHSSRHYLTIWGVLVALLTVSVLGPMLEIRVVTLITAFGIALVKAYLVCKHFMHLDVQPRYIVYLLVTGIVMILLFFFGVAPDVLHHEGENWANRAAQEHVRIAMSGEAAHEAGPFVVATAFESTCGPCHGATGAGDGPGAAGLDPHPADFTSPEFWATRDRAHVIDTIRRGGAAIGRSPLMPAFGERFDEEQLEALADHVVELGGEAAATEAEPEGETPVEGVEGAPTEGAEGEPTDAIDGEPGAAGAEPTDEAPSAAAERAPAEAATPTP